MDDESVESQKLRIERDKLEFEIRKFDEERPRRQQEMLKLELENRELGRHWYEKSTYLGPVATIAVALVGGMIAFGTNILHSDIFALRSERTTLQQEVKAKQLAEANLNNSLVSLRRQRDTLIEENAHLRGTNDLLQRDNRSLTYETQTQELRRVLSTIPTAGSLVDSAVTELLQIADGANRDQIAALKAAYSEKVTGSSATSDAHAQFQALVALALFRATKDSTWKTQLHTVALEGVAKQLAKYLFIPRDSIFLGLLRDRAFSNDERAQNLRSMYVSAKKGGPLEDDTLLVLAKWDSDATIAFRDPWFDYLAALYQRREWEKLYTVREWGNLHRPRAPLLLDFAPQGFATLLMKSVVEKSQQLTEAEYRVPNGQGVVSNNDGFPPDHVSCPFFPVSFPLCSDWDQKTQHENDDLPFLIHPNSIAAYTNWLHDNPELVSAWTDPAFKVLRICSADTMRRIVDQQWVTLVDLKTTRR